MRKYKIWGGDRAENDSLYIWAKDADDAIGIARLTDQSICISQWTGNEKSYEEQLDWLYRLRSEIYVYMPKEWLIPMNNALDMAIKALEQEPCEDAVSRQAAIDALHFWFKDGFDEDKWWNSTHVLAAIEGLPSAQPERKKGKWRDHQEGDWIYAKCSLCGAVQDSRSNFCPNCGAEMEGEEESK